MNNTTVGLSVEVILNTAAKLFANSGYRATSLNDVARLLNVSKPALYYHFKNKHEILSSIFTIIMDIYLEKALEIGKLSISPKQKLEMLIESHALAVLNNKEYSIIFFKESIELDADSREKLNVDMKIYEDIFKEVIDNGIKEGTFKNLDSNALVMGIFGMTNWLYYWFEEKGELSKEQICNLYLTVLQTGYLK
ncbi:TetR/AcrR family transcriptional regulator [Peribacillus frigoritolerans]|uniref:TetR family transcriptional regulator n=1 Tax=Peribacillus frigoritolerans TaxID=450367 RepID=UPI0039A1D4F2